MAEEQDVADHYTSGSLLERLLATLAEDGIDTTALSVEKLAPYDQFHGRGIEATVELAALLDVSNTDHLLDVGCGIGGPARYMASRFGCPVTGIDLTNEFCVVARELNERVGLKDQIDIREGNALSMPFGDGVFDGAYSMNVSMNIEDKSGFYREIHRVLKPGGWFVLIDVSDGPAEGPEYPTPWAKTSDTSFLSTPDATRAGLEQAGFVITDVRDNLEAILDFGVRSKKAVEATGKPLQRAVGVIHGSLADTVIANSGRAMKEGALVPLEIMCKKT